MVSNMNKPLEAFCKSNHSLLIFGEEDPPSNLSTISFKEGKVSSKVTLHFM